MRRGLFVLALSLFLGGGANAQEAALEPGEFVSSLFFHLCLMHLPHYQGADLALKAAGYKPFAFNGGAEFEFAHASNGVWGAFDTSAEDNNGCSIRHQSLSEVDTQQIGLRVANEYSDVEPMMWKYEGVPSGWVVPYEDKFLYIIYNEGGISSDIRDK